MRSTRSASRSSRRRSAGSSRSTTGPGSKRHSTTCATGTCSPCRLGRNLLEGLIVLNDLFERGIAVKVLEGIAAGEHTERSFVLDMALALAEDRRRDIVRKTRNGLEAARKRGRVGGRPRVIDDDKRAAILSRRERGESIRVIAAGVGISVGAVHNALTEEAAADRR